MNIASKILVGLLFLSSTATAEMTCGQQNTAIKPTTPTADFIVHNDGTVTHSTTGLMWMRCNLGERWENGRCAGLYRKYTWQEALSNNGDGYAGYTDWRLPNKNELASIVEHRCWNPSTNQAIFPTSRPSWYWTSTPVATNPGMAWNIHFSDGDLHILYKTDDHYVRLVRTP